MPSQRDSWPTGAATAFVGSAIYGLMLGLLAGPAVTTLTAAGRSLPSWAPAHLLWALMVVGLSIVGVIWLLTSPGLSRALTVAAIAVGGLTTTGLLRVWADVPGETVGESIADAVVEPVLGGLLLVAAYDAVRTWLDEREQRGRDDARLRELIARLVGHSALLALRAEHRRSGAEKLADSDDWRQVISDVTPDAGPSVEPPHAVARAMILGLFGHDPSHATKTRELLESHLTRSAFHTPEALPKLRVWAKACSDASLAEADLFVRLQAYEQACVPPVDPAAYHDRRTWLNHAAREVRDWEQRLSVVAAEARIELDDVLELV